MPVVVWHTNDQSHQLITDEHSNVDFKYSQCSSFIIHSYLTSG